MKPLLLVLQALGPYPGRQPVDFRPVLDGGLFGIYGATGSGKSTIFSAMMFALFGEAARSEQPATTLRSDHADPDLLTLVEMVFSVGAHSYRIVRQPEQMRRARRGTGETREPHKAWLFDVTGMDVDALCDTNPGRLIAEAKVKAVDEAVKNILGYGPAQFRQVVLLPQGRFEAFLSAGTSDRTEILHGLFDISLYRRLSERIKADADAAQRAVAAARAVATGRLAAESFESMDALIAGIAEFSDKARQQTGATAEARSAWEGAIDAYAAAARTDASFREHSKVEQEMAQLDAARPGIEALIERLKIARSLQSLADAASALDSARREAVEAVAREKEAAARLELATARAQSTATSLKELTGRLAGVEKHKTTLQTFRDYEEQLDRCEELGDLSQAADRAAASAHAAARAAQVSLEKLSRKREQLDQSLQLAQESEVKRSHLEMQAAELRRHHADAKSYELARERAAQAQRDADIAASKAAAATETLQVADNDFARSEAALLTDQAAHLATRLSPGASCPVCGSKDHPAPAGSLTAGTDAGAAYQSAKSSLEAARRTAEAARTDAHLAAGLAQERDAAFASLVVPDKKSVELSASLRRIEAELSGLPAVSTDSLRQALLDAGQQHTAAAQAQETARQRQTETAIAAAAARQAYESALAAIPLDLRDRTALAAAIEQLAGEISRFQLDHAEAVSADRDAATHLSAAAREAETLAAEAHRGQERLAREEERFTTRLSAAGLTFSDYESRKSDLASIPAFEQQLREYTEKRAAAADRLERARSTIANLSRPDLAALASARDAAEVQYDSLLKTLSDTDARLRQLEKLQSELSDEADRLEKLERETAPVRELAEVFAGHNTFKVTLETFAISALFDRVLESANLRLGPMTRGRYALVREIEGKGVARRGLGIAVDDSYTGRQRPTSTLSGGETFIAALALALGLSDVVESAHGSVRLDTIFIDEGFGSLDSDTDSGTLDTVLQTLQDIVGATRSVGVISHVPLVQQAIPAGFFVTKTAGGSHIDLRL